MPKWEVTAHLSHAAFFVVDQTLMFLKTPAAQGKTKELFLFLFLFFIFYSQ
jgi:hypothetical protein